MVSHDKKASTAPNKCQASILTHEENFLKRTSRIPLKGAAKDSIHNEHETVLRQQFQSILLGVYEIPYRLASVAQYLSN
jgi:hypothetical protein